MRTNPFGKLGSVSTLTLGGGGIGQIWGPTTREECVATVREAVDSGITLLDMAASYGDGEAESVVGEALDGRIPEGVRITTKCRVGDTPAADVYAHLERSLTGSCERMRVEKVDIFFLHNWIVPAGPGAERHSPLSLVREAIVPALQRLVREGRANAWGLTGIGEPDPLLDILANGPQPDYIQCIANLLDSPGGLGRFEGPARPREIIAAAGKAGVSVMGIRAVQAGALTSAIDRYKEPDNPETLDFHRAAPFRAIAAEAGQTPAFLAHQYAMSMDGIATVVLGVKNREELRECIAAEAAGPMDPALVARIDAAVAV